MIKKQLDMPIKIRKIEALLRRTHPSHHKRQMMLDEHTIRQAGLQGEQSLDYHLSFINNDYQVFHGLRIPDSEGRFFQMDLLLLSQKYFIIVEVKSHRGTLIFDQKSNQLIRELNEKKTGFQDPILQIRRHRNQLKSLLIKHKLPLLPIETLVNVSNQSSIIQIEPPNHPISNMIIHTDGLQNKVEKFEEKYKKDHLTSKDLNRFSRILLKENQPHNPDILPQFQMERADIFRGVHCPKCFQLAMTRKYGYWHCGYCEHKSKMAHVNTLEDYAMLISDTITNTQCRHFLQITSKNIACNILTSLNLPFTGTIKNRQYSLNPLIFNK